MKLHFGTALDNRAYPHSTSQNQGSLIAGPTKLLTYLEEICLSPYHETSEAYAHIRLEFTRKLLQDILTDQDDAFFKDSFVAGYGSSFLYGPQSPTLQMAPLKTHTNEECFAFIFFP